MNVERFCARGSVILIHDTLPFDPRVATRERDVAGNRAAQSPDQEHYEYRIVELPGDRDEVRHEIERQRQVGQNSEDCDPIGTAHARIANEAAEQMMIRSPRACRSRGSIRRRATHPLVFPRR